MDNYHEKITISLLADKPMSRKDLHEFLTKMGYKSMDDFYFVKRKDEIKFWQSSNLLTLDVYMNNVHKYETEEDIESSESTEWNRLDLYYLMATIPSNHITAFVDQVEQLSNSLGLSIKYEGELTSSRKLDEALTSIANQLTSNLAPPGTEDLAILIEMDYQ
jgi:hypothetical protein